MDKTRSGSRYACPRIARLGTSLLAECILAAFVRAVNQAHQGDSNITIEEANNDDTIHAKRSGPRASA